MNDSSANRIRLGMILAAAIFFGAGTFWYWKQHRTPPIPEVPTAGLDAEVVTALNRARSQVEKEPRSAAAWGQYGIVAFAHDKYAECVPLFERAEQLDDKDHRWPYFHGLALNYEHPDQSIVLLQHARELSPTNVTIQLRLAEIELAQDQTDEAEALFRSVLVAHPDNPRALLGLGKIFLRQGMWKEALDSFKRAAPSPTSQKSAHLGMADAYRRLNNPTAAETERSLADASPPDQSWPDPLLAQAEKVRTGLIPRLEKAEARISAHMLEDALDDLQQITRDHPESDLAQIRLAKLLIRMNRMDDAAVPLQAAIAINAHQAEAYFLMAGLQMVKNDFAGAEASYIQAVTEKPTYGLAHYNLGQCRLKRGNRSGAEEAFRAAVRTRSDLVLTHLALGKLLLEMGNRPEAITNLENALKIDPGNSEIKSLLDQARQK